MQSNARTRIKKKKQKQTKTNIPSIERWFYLFSTRTICGIFLFNWTQSIHGFSLYYKDVTKVNDAKNLKRGKKSNISQVKAYDQDKGDRYEQSEDRAQTIQITHSTHSKN